MNVFRAGWGSTLRSREHGHALAVRQRRAWVAVVMVALATGCIHQQHFAATDNRRLAQIALNATVRSLVWGEETKAAIAFEKSSTAYPASVRRHMFKGISGWICQDFTAMAQEFADVLVSDPDNAEAHAFLGIALAHMQRFEEAHEAVKKALALAPELPDANLALAEVLRAEGNKEEGVRVLRALIDREPAHEPAYVLLGDLLFDLGRYDETATVMRKAIRIFPPSFAKHRGRLGRALEMQGDLHGAKKAFSESLRARPLWPPAISNMGRVLLDTGEPVAAARILRKGAKLFPENVVIRSLLGKALRDVGDYEGARSEFEATLRLDADATATRVDLGQLLFNHLGERAHGLDLLRAGAGEQPKAAYTHRALALALGKAGKLDEAESVFLEALRLDPKDASGHGNLAFVYVLRRDYIKALKHYQEAVKLEPRSGRRHSDAAGTLLFLGKYEDAWSHVHEAQKLGFHVSRVLLNRLRTKMPEPAVDKGLAEPGK